MCCDQCLELPPYVAREYVKPGVKPNPTLRLVTQVTTGAIPQWSGLEPQLGKPPHLKVHLERHVPLEEGDRYRRFHHLLSQNIISTSKEEADKDPSRPKGTFSQIFKSHSPIIWTIPIQIVRDVYV
jgi:hypothetical protein